MAGQSVSITLGGRAYSVERARLGGFLRLQQARDLLNKGIETGGNGEIVGGIFDFLRVCIPELSPKDFHSAPWYEAFNAYLKLEALNRLPHGTDFAIIQFQSASNRKVPWDNPLRAIIIWIHLIAKSYGWSKEEIEYLWPEEAVAYVQEIMADEQTQREFMHSLSEIAYPYDKATKKARYKPLQRPAWMVLQTDAKGIVTKLRKDMMPVGKVLYPKDADEELKPHE